MNVLIFQEIANIHISNSLEDDALKMKYLYCQQFINSKGYTFF